MVQNVRMLTKANAPFPEHTSGTPAARAGQGGFNDFACGTEGQLEVLKLCATKSSSRVGVVMVLR